MYTIDLENVSGQVSWVHMVNCHKQGDYWPGPGPFKCTCLPSRQMYRYMIVFKVIIACITRSEQLPVVRKDRDYKT